MPKLMVLRFTCLGIPEPALLRIWFPSGVETRPSAQILSGAASAPILCQEIQLRQVAPQPLTRRRTRLLLGGLLLSRVGTRTTYSQKPTLSTTTAIRQVPCWLRSIPTRRFRTALPHQIGFLLLPREAQSSRLLTTLLLGDTRMQFTTKAGCSI